MAGAAYSFQGIDKNLKEPTGPHIKGRAIRSRHRQLDVRLMKPQGPCLQVKHGWRER